MSAAWPRPIGQMKRVGGEGRRGVGRNRLCTALAVVLLAEFAWMAPAVASSRVLSHIETGREHDRVKVRVHLNVPMRYISHASSGNGDTVLVQLATVAVGKQSEQPGDQEETLAWDPSGVAPLVEVRYEPVGQALFLRFTGRVNAEATGSADLRSIVVTLAPRRSPAAKPQVAPEIVPAMAPEAVAVKADADARRQPTARAGDGGERRYAINLASTLATVDLDTIARPAEFAAYQLYVTSYERDGKTWHRLRLGFFQSRAEAELLAAASRGEYPQAWVTMVTPEEAERGASRKVAKVPPAVSGKPKPQRAREVQSGGLAHKPTLPPISAERLADLYGQVKHAMTAGDYDSAVKLCTKILQYPQHEYRRDTLELLGLARERKGQFAHAKAEYEEYLKLYPQGEASDRVRQRLSALVTARRPLKQKLRIARTRDQKSDWDIFGSLSQFYRRDESFTDVNGRQLNTSTLSNDVNASSRTRGQDYAVRTQITGGYEQNFRSGDESDLRVLEFYVDAERFSSGVSSRVGRQSRSVGGVLGRFDGALVGYQFADLAKVNLVAGFPVDSSTIDRVNTNRYFYGLSFDVGTFRKYWDINTYIIEQRIDEIADRRAIGGEVRYFDGSRSLFGAIDYDLLFKELNSAILLGTVTTQDGTTVNLSFDFRKSPVLTASNALQGPPLDGSGQPITSIDDLLDVYSSNQVRRCASDRTADSRTATLGASHSLNPQLQLSGDFMISNLSGTDASCGVDATDGTGNEFFYSTQLVGSSLLKQGDIAILGLRYSDTSTAKAISADLNTRYPITPELRFNPRLRTDYRKLEAGGEDYGAQASARLEYRWRRRLRLELELGGEWSDNTASTDGEELGYFLNVGYRWDF